MATKKEIEYLYEKAVAWEREAIAAKNCLWYFALEGAKMGANMREDKIDFEEIKSILSENGFSGFYREALKKLGVRKAQR
jgi:hypothetical protein